MASHPSVLTKITLVLLCGVDLSNLVNLKRLILDCPKSFLGPGTVGCMCFVLGQTNTTCLEEITLCVSSEDKLECITEMDKSLCTDKFCNLKRFNLLIAPDPKVKDWDTTAVPKPLLPGVEARGILHLVASRKAGLP